MTRSTQSDAPADSAQLRASEVRYRRLFEAAQDGILILDIETGFIMDANPSIARLVGYSRDELIGQQLWELGLFENIALAKGAFKKLQESGYVRYENMPLRTKDGRVTEVEFVSSRYRSNGDVVAQCNIRDITKRTAIQQKIVRDSNTDFLTGIANRKHLEERMQGEFKRSVRYGHPLSLLLLDIDHFKRINDEHGHATGDSVLKVFASECVAQLRDVDIVGRIGGEEFCALLPETGGQKALEIGERLRSAIAALHIPISTGAVKAVQITVSIGVATLGQADKTVESLQARADARLYDAKHSGRNCVCSEPPLT